MSTNEAAELPRRVSELSEIERRWAEANHEGCNEGPPHGLEAHEPFDVEEGDEPWSAFEQQLARHGLRLVMTGSLAETEGCLLRECDHDYTADCVDGFRARLSEGTDR